MHVEVYIPFVCAILCCVLYSGSQGLGLNQCVSGYLEVPDTLQSVDDALTCKGIPASDTLRWAFRPKNHAGAPLRIGSCEPHSLNCKLQLSPNNPIFTIRRPSDDVSHLSLAREVSRNLAGATFYCLSESDSTDCRVDIVYPAEGVNCTAQFDSSPSTQWTLSGRCDVKKIYSALNRYSCTWYESDGTSQKPVDTRFVAFSPTPSSGDFSSGPCSVTEKTMSTACKELEYNYQVKISPGSGKTEVSFTGSNVIQTDHSETECRQSDTSAFTGVQIGVGVGIGVPAVIAVVIVIILLWCQQCRRRNNRGAENSSGARASQQTADATSRDREATETSSQDNQNRLFVKCGECHKWRKFTVPSNDDILQDIFVQSSINEIFKCANHDNTELSLDEIQNILKSRGMGDTSNVRLEKLIWLKCMANGCKWRKQEQAPDENVLKRVKDKVWTCSGAGEEKPGRMDDLQMRLYLLSNPE